MSEKSYFRIGRYYVRKMFVAVILVLFTFLPLILIGFVFPYITKNLFPRWFTKTMYVNAEERLDYTGRVKLTAAQQRDTVLFIGTLKEGRIEGEGVLYDYDGNVLYRGSFAEEMYSGAGTEYYPDGNVKYQGNYVLNQYEGEGVLHYRDGTKKKQGTFVAGLFEG
ncbi:MAG: hypothetical protein K2K56_11160, partial [Lachnospiraceae bacterium]|nr:hypothetical protein [Lachnospiraceae bacterium]